MQTSFISSMALGLVLAATFTGTGVAGTFKTITIDGSFGDWVGIPEAHEDPADATTSADYRRIWIANDEDYLYLRFTLERAEDPFTSNDNIFIDADADPTTGYGVFVGSEMLIQGGAGYQEKGGQFNEGAILDLGWQAAPVGSGTEFEVRISRHARYESDGATVLGFPYLSLLLEAEDANFARQETAPDTEGIYYEFAEPPPVLTSATSLVTFQDSWRHLSSDNPDASWKEPDFDDTQAGWAAGTPLFGYTANAGAYPLPIGTPLPTAPVSHYLRTRFDWNNNAAGVLFVVTNLLSDGAALYLNGAEIQRVRLPEGPITPATLATGGPSTEGAPEIFAVDPGALVQGENVLAVEVHQGTSTADLVFGLSLVASPSFPVTLLDPDEPADRAVISGETTTFSVQALGSPPLVHQWLKNGEVIADATNAVLTLDPVLPQDAGTYSVRISNAATPAGVVSRAATLTILHSPVAITQQPASLTVTAGLTASLTVAATGSAPLQYQWYKGEVPVTGATNATLVFESVAETDAGDYSVEVSNPAPSSVRSATARLTVSADVTPLALTQVEGSPNQVIVSFSEPVDPETGGAAANYVLSGGLTVTSATVNASDPTQVVLATGAQTLGSQYELTVTAVEDRFGNVIAAGSRRTFVSTIRVDGIFDDWNGVPQVVDDPQDAPNATDYAAAWIASDATHIYLRVRLHVPSILSIFYNNIFIDADNNLETGFRIQGVGSEMLIQGGGGYQQRNGGFNEGQIENLDWQISPEGEGSEFELKFSRAARYVEGGERVFSGDTIALVLESENTSFVTVDLAPDVEPIVHTFTVVPPPELGTLSVSRTATGLAISWDGAGRLQSTTSLGGLWTDVENASSPYAVTPDGAARFFRLTE